MIGKSKKEILESFGDSVQESFDPELVRAFDKADEKVDPELIKPENVRLLKDKFRVSGDGFFYTLQGEGETMGRPCVFLRLHICNLRCLDYRTKITMSDFSKKELKDIQVGDVLLGVKKEGNKTLLVPNKVLHKWESDSKEKVIKLSYDNNELLCTEDHLIFTNTRGEYLPAGSLAKHTGKTLFSVDKIPENEDYIKGYLAGLVFGDGSVSPGNKFSFACTDRIFAERVQDFIFKYSGKSVKIHSYRKTTAGNTVYDIRWMSKDFVPSISVVESFENKDYFAGYFAAWFDSDGNWSNRNNVRLSRSCDKESILEIKNYLKKHFNIESSIKTVISPITKSGVLHKFVLYGSRVAKVKFLLDINIVLKRKLRLDKSILLKTVDFETARADKETKLMDVHTETGNLFAENLLIHNCWFCDAFYTWNPNSEEFWKESKLFSVDEVIAKLEETWVCENKDLTPRIIITGGEPLLQKDLIEQVMKKRPNWFYEIETNGTIMPTDYILEQSSNWIKENNVYFPRVQFNCSPKLASSGNLVQAARKPEVIKALTKVGTLFKFVVMSNEDLDEIENVWMKEMEIPINQVCLMPQGVTSKEVENNGKKVVEYAKQKGFRLLLRLQNSLWGAKRRV